jgi:nucleoside 2-deoxyribosyltransferase
MGMTNAPTKCFITNEKTNNIPSSLDGIEYSVNYAGKELFFTFHWNHENSKFVKDNIYILLGLIANEKFCPKQNYFLDNIELEKIIKTAIVPKTPREKLDNLLILFHKIQENEGNRINFDSKRTVEFLANTVYLKNYQEFLFYTKALAEMNYITAKFTKNMSIDFINDVAITFHGFEHILCLQENGEKSNNCFIAMSFSEDVKDIRTVIKNVVEETGYTPILIDEIHYESDLTINDAIIKNIKKSKFLIADFTNQKHGVYFEAGFALGLKRPVIYTCSEKDFENTHFDTNHYPHIVYSNLDELNIKLKNKIEAWIS